jgi:hypothetical protein
MEERKVSLFVDTLLRKQLIEEVGTNQVGERVLRLIHSGTALKQEEEEKKQLQQEEGSHSPAKEWVGASPGDL